MVVVNFRGNKMKILFTVQNYYPRMSGVPVVVKYLAEGLQKKGHLVTVATRRDKELEEFEIINGVKVYRFDIAYSKFKGHYGEIDKYINFIKNYECDIIINECTQCETTDLLLKSLDSIKKPKILHAHGLAGLTLKPIALMPTIKNTLGNTFNWIRWNIYYNKFASYILQYDTVICLSELDSGKKYIEKNFDKTINILDNAANDMFFMDSKENALKKYLGKSCEKYIISVANYTAVKNQKMILKSFYMSTITDYTLVFIGGKKTSFYYRLCKLKERYDKKFGFKNVYILTGVDRENIPSIVGGAKIYMVSSTYEEYSISIIEAMAKSVPFISTNVGNASILPGGIVVNSVEEMKAGIELLLNNEHKRAELGAKGKEYSELNCREVVAVDKLERIIRNTIKS